MARKDSEKVLAENSSYPGPCEYLANFKTKDGMLDSRAGDAWRIVEN